MTERIHKGRNPVIDYWKFIFSVLIAVFHAKEPGFVSETLLSNGNMGVEFFFIVSGWTLAASVKRKNDNPLDEKSSGSETVAFLWRKFSKIFPYLFIAVGIGFVALYICSHYGSIYSGLCRSLDEILLVQMAGWKVGTITGTSWYLSAMLIAMAVLYPIMRRHYDFFCKIAAPLIGVLGLGLLWSVLNCFGGPRKIVLLGFIPAGLVRAFAEISLGAAAHSLSQTIAKVNFTAFARVLFSVLSNLALVGYLLCAIFMPSDANLSYLYTVSLLLIFPIAFIFSGQEILSNVLPDKLPSLLAKFSLALYLNHYYWGEIIDRASWSDTRKLTAYLLAAVATAALCMTAVTLLQKLWKNKNLKRLFVKEQAA